MALQFVDERLFVVLQIVDVNSAIFASRANQTRVLLLFGGHDGTKGAPDGVLRLSNADTFAESEGVVFYGQPVEEQVVWHGVDQQVWSGHVLVEPISVGNARYRVSVVVDDSCKEQTSFQVNTPSSAVSQCLCGQLTSWSC